MLRQDAVSTRRSRGDGQEYFSAALTAAIALIVLAYLLIFPSFLAATALHVARR